MQSCAIREVFEETSFDISKTINEEDWIKQTTHKVKRLYIKKNVSVFFPMKPRNENEILSCEWFNINHLTTETANKKKGINIRSKEFILFLPFLKQNSKIMNPKYKMLKIMNSK